MNTTNTISETESTAAQQLLQKLPPKHVEPLWTVMKSMVTAQPSPKAEVALWKYDQLRPLLLEAGKVVPTEQAERRVLMLINPALKAPFTTDTLYAGLQLINPNETAPAHRHRAFALRFIIEGTQGFTAVEGEKVYMNPGDMILTPRWKWHDHGHEGDEPMIWLDGLDLPLYHCLPTHFAEGYVGERQASSPVADRDSTLRFPFEAMKSRLNATANATATLPPWTKEHYLTGTPPTHISATLGAHAERLRAGHSSRWRRDTCSYIYHVHAGSGMSEITLWNGETKRVRWGPHDTFCVPGWSGVVHTADADVEGEREGNGDVYLFVLSDLPLLERLGMYREDKDEE